MSARRTPRVGGGKTNAPPPPSGGPATTAQLSARMEKLSARLSARQSSARGSARPPRSGRPMTSADGAGLGSSREQILSSRSGAGNQVDDYINNQRSARAKTPGLGSARGSARSRMFDMPTATSANKSSALSVGSIGDPADYLEKMRQTKMAEARAKAKKEVAEFEGHYNQYSRPKVSSSIPLRSAFLDPKINNIPKSKTRSELLRKIKANNIPHHSFDIDGDGYVSQEDLLLGKRFDLDGNGLLDPEEVEIGRRIIAEEFFKAHRHDLHLFGEDYHEHSESDNIEKVATSHTFTKIMNGLKEKEKHYRDRGSYNMTEALTVWNPEVSPAQRLHMLHACMFCHSLYWLLDLTKKSQTIPSQRRSSSRTISTPTKWTSRPGTTSAPSPALLTL